MKISLVGFAFSGKSTIGKMLAYKLNIEHFDSDEIIKKSYGDIRDIFAEHGEEYFRDIEEKIINDIVQNKNDFVLSTGGGAVVRDSTIKLLEENTTVIWLKTSLESIIKRDNRKKEHPLFEGEQREETIKKLFSQRINSYAFADITVDTDNKAAKKTVNEILNLINSD